MESNTNMFGPLDKASGEPTKYLAQISVPINQTASITWQSFENTLNNCLDTFTVRQAISVVEECIKLENYLHTEFQLNDKEIYFINQKQIVDHLNKSLKKKLFSLSRSTELFNQHKRDLVSILNNKLIPKNLSDVLGHFDHLEGQYYKLVETIKSRLKFKIAKLEKNLQVWQEFDKLCRKLNSLFDSSSNIVSMESGGSLLEYRGLVHEVSRCLNNLKEHHSLLSATCTENKYFEMKNLIVLYECKFGRLKEKVEAANNVHLKYFTRTTESEENFYLENRMQSCRNGSDQNEQRKDCVYNRNNNSELNSSDNDNQVIPVMMANHSRPNNNTTKASVLRHRSNKKNGNDTSCVYINDRAAPGTGRSNEASKGVLTSQDLNQAPTESNKSPIARRKALMCDKSTFTINEISTQTEEPFEYHMNQVLTREHLRTIGQNRHYTKRFTNKDSSSSENQKPDLTESDGKQLLLEAYLRNNESLVQENQQDSSQTASSQSSSSLLPNALKGKSGKKRKSLTTTGTRESGIGTYIDDEIGTSSCDLDMELSKTSSSEKQKVNNSYQNTDNESLDKLNSKSVANTNEAYYSKTTNKVNKAKGKLINKTRHLSKSNTVKNSFESQNIYNRKQSVDHKQQPFFIEDTDVNFFESKTTGWFSWFFKTFFTFLLFFLTILFVIFVYFFYSLVLNPSCCDYKRQYLMFNVS